MKIFGIELSPEKRRLQEQAEAEKRAKEAVPAKRSSTIQIARIPRIRTPILSFKQRPGSDYFEQPEYDLAEVGRIEDTESYVRRAFRYKEGLMFKEGWELIGANKRTISYIKERFAQMDQATSIPHPLLIRGIGADLVRFSNAFLVKVRKTEASGGKIRTIPGTSREIQPVAGYFAIPPTTIEIRRDENGNVIQYRQHMPSGQYKDFPAENIIHFYFDRKKGFLVGTPFIIPVKDDIRALRRIEENIELLIYQCLFPLFHYTVGTEKAPAREYSDGTSEIDIVKAEIELMPAEGAIVTSERHEIKAIGAEGRALRAEGYLTHFKQRVFSGLGVSAIDMGEGDTANRSTADNMSRNMVDDVKAMQRELEIFLNEYIIKEMLLESTFPNPLDPASLVFFKFREIDLAEQIKVENHAVNAFAGYALTHDELRARFGREPFSKKDEENSYWKKYEEPKMLIQAMDEPYSAEAKAAARSPQTSIVPGDLSSEETARAAEQKRMAKAKIAAKPKGKGKKTGPKKTKKTSGQRAAAASTAPANQHGQNQGPTKRKSSMSFSDMVGKGNRLTGIYDDLLEDTLLAIDKKYFNEDWFAATTRAASTLMRERLLPSLRLAFREGFRSSGAPRKEREEAFPLSMIGIRADRMVDRFASRLVSRVRHEIQVADTDAEKKQKIRDVFDALRFRSRFIFNSERNRAFNYGAALGLKQLGHQEADIDVSKDACEECRHHAKNIPLDHVVIDDLPGFHPNCECRVVAPRK